MNCKPYQVLFTPQAPDLQGSWEGDIWGQTPALSIDCFRPEGSSHRPRTLCKLRYDDRTLFGLFRVEDQFVRCTHTGFQTEVWKDSCVELFVQPAGSPGYFNLEFNCGGALLASYVTNPARVEGRLQGFTVLSPEADRHILRHTSLPAVVEPEIATSCTWTLAFALPFSVLERFTGLLDPVGGQTWRANFYKCGNETSHPHWASWQPLAARNFHDPASFGTLIFKP